MEFFAVPQTKFRFLVCSDVDGYSVTKLTEQFVYSEPEFDAILLSGPFTHETLNTPEEIAVMQGDIASIIAQFENLVCRVVYLPSECDPPSVRNDQLHLTPNSLNIHGRQLSLAPNLRVLGFSEKNEELSTGRVPHHVDRSPESDDELENVSIAAGLSASIIREMLQNSTSEDLLASDSSAHAALNSTSSDPTSGSGIFMLNYRYSHTLNQLLFHMGGDLDQAGISLCVITSADCPETSRLPVKFGKLYIAAPKSLRRGGNYLIVDMELNPDTQKWDKISIEAHTMQ